MDNKLKELLGLNEDKKIIKTEWMKDAYLHRYGIAYLIKDTMGNIIWEPDSASETISPFPKGYTPEIGKSFSLTTVTAGSFYNSVFPKVYTIKNSYLLTREDKGIEILIVNEVEI